MKRLGVIGTMVWDTIHRDTHGPVAEWGGIAYALAALDVALPTGWTIVPLIKVGRDLAHRAARFLAALSHIEPGARFIEVPEPNNRVTLRYHGDRRRTERLAGGVPPWRWDELGPMIRDLDALYVNMISGRECDLNTAASLRRGFDRPIYADLHSLLLGLRSDGLRLPRALPQPDEWFACCDVVQLNEDEFALLGDDPMAVAARALGAGVGLLVVTVGAGGAVYFTRPSFTFRHRGTPAAAPGLPIETARVPAEPVAEALDPTGCGDVFGATLVCGLLAGATVPLAIREANRLAAKNAAYRGATHLQYHLRGEIIPR